jgi:hypothetical protein
MAALHVDYRTGARAPLQIIRISTDILAISPPIAVITAKVLFPNIFPVHVVTF